jgi:hypothetical protein
MIVNWRQQANARFQTRISLEKRIGDLSSIDVAEAWNAVCVQFSRNF